jgi:hypothetical protein
MSKEALERRSVKKIRRVVRKEQQRRDRLLDEGKLSLPRGTGKLIIVASPAADFRLKLSPEKQHEIFCEEAERLAEERAAQHDTVEIRRKAIMGDINIDLADPEVTDIALIGHGTISDFWANHGRHFNWLDAAKATRSHLKQGVVEQRMCGNFSTRTRYSVPLGTFAVSNLENVVAALGQKLPEHDPPEELFRPIYDNSRDLLEQVDQMNMIHGSFGGRQEA